MFKPAKKKPTAKGTTTVDFKLEFHATRVPQRGWDKLLVSLIYLETGKVTAKTGKVSVKNGNCQWSEPLYESIHVSKDPKRKDSDKELYKIIVSMGLSRFGILGETTINLADHMQAIVPVSLSLQLQNCNCGSMLHIKIQRIMGKPVSRDLQDAKESILEEDSQPAMSEDQLDSKPSGPEIVENSKVPKILELPESNKEESSPQSVHRYSSDSLDIPSTPGVSESRSYGKDALGDGSTSPSSSVSSSNGRPESGNGFSDYIGFNRSTIDHNEVSSLAMYDKPRRSFGSHNYTPVCSLRASTDGVRELQDKLEYEKSVNSNLNLQLQKSQEANAELLSEIEDLEKVLVQKREIEKEMNGIQALSDTNADLKNTVDGLKKELEELERDSQELTEENLDLLSQLKQANDKLNEKDHIISQLESREMVNDLREKLKMSEESYESKLTNCRTLIDDLNTSIAVLRSQNAHLEREVQSAEDDASALLMEIQNLKTEIDAHQKEKLLLASQKGQLKGLREKATKAEQDCTKALKRVKELDEKNEHLQDEYDQAITNLEQQLKSAEERALATDERHAAALQVMKALLEAEKLSVQDSRTAFEAKIEDLQSMNEELQEKLQSAREEGAWGRENTNTLVQEIRALEAEIEAGKLARNRMEVSVSELEGQKGSLQRQVENLSERNLHMEEKLFDCEARDSKAVEEKEALLVMLQEKARASKEQEASLQTVIKQQQDKIQHARKEIWDASRDAEDKRKVIWDLNSTIENMKKDLASKELSYLDLHEQIQKEKTVSAALEDELSKLHRDIEEKEKCFSEKIQVLQISKQDLKLKADKAEEMLTRSTLEKVSSLQQEIKQLSSQMSSTCDDKKRLATQALSEASVLQADKVDLEEQLENLQETLKQASKDALFVKENLEFKVEEALAKEAEMARKLEEVVREVEVLQMERVSYTRRIAELEVQCIRVEHEKENLASQISAIRNRAGENELWQMEAEKARNDLVTLRQEMMEANMHADKAAEEVASLKERAQSQEEAARIWKKSKAALEEKIARLQESNAKGGRPLEEKIDSNKLRKQASDLRRKLLEQELERDELKKRVSYLEEELHRKANALALAERKLKVNGGRPVSLLARSLSKANSKVEPMSPSCDPKELVELREKVKCLELSRLQNQNAAQRENELLSKLSSQEALLESLKQEKQELTNLLSTFNTAAKGENLVTRFLTLETELAEVMEANKMYKSQLQSAFAEQQNVHAAALQSHGDLEQVIQDLAELKRKNGTLEDELGDMRERYFKMSLQFAEVEAEREELVMTLRNLRGAKKLMPHRSANF